MSSNTKPKKAHIPKAYLTIRGENWEPFVTRNMSFWHQHLSSRGIFHHLKDFGVEYQTHQLALTINGTETHIFQISGSLLHESDVALASVIGEAKMKTLEEKYKHEAGVLLSVLDECLCSVTIEHWQKFCAQYKKFCAALQITAIVGRIGADRLTKRLHELGYEESAIPNLIGVITYPDEHTPLFLSQKELYEIAEKGQNENLSDAALHGHVIKWLDRHAHIPVNFCEDPWTHAGVTTQLSVFKKEDVAEKLKRLKLEQGEKIKKAREILHDINDTQVYSLAVTISKATILNEFRKNVFSRVSLEYRPIFEAVARRVGGASWRDCFYLTAEEMGQVISGKDIALQRKKEERKTVAFFVDKKGEVVFLNPGETEKVFNFVGQFRGGTISKTPRNLETPEIQGFSASAGIVRGTVKVVISSKDFSKVNRGDILVAIMTSVDFIPVMERAAAFVTNEGGITSHASIVAREMSKPCIIGTNIATKILKDGDMVEVDAERGIVTIISRG
ncbi:MAG: PEP-utilizing enzyme [bacterium]|nr:PEP-utilizing enzyme [bacterium]